MNDYYEKYLKGKTTSLLVKNETKEELNEMKYDLKIKSVDGLIDFLIQYYKKDQKSL
jgi:hypothetical protein